MPESQIEFKVKAPIESVWGLMADWAKCRISSTAQDSKHESHHRTVPLLSVPLSEVVHG